MSERTEALSRLRAAVEFAKGELTKRNLPFPRTVEDIEHLARVFEIPFAVVKDGTFTFRDVYDYMLAWEDRERIRQQVLRSKPEPSGVSPNDERDEFIYRNRCCGLSNKKIRAEIRTHKNWGPLSTDQAVSIALKRYCKRKGLDLPRRKA
jgi:hypothetical protein